MTSYAMQEATAVSEIGFPEFTAKLVTDVFEALINANLTQMEAYTELSKTMQDGLTAYINNTKNDVPAEAILELLIAKFPSATKNSKLSEEDAEGLNALVKPILPPAKENADGTTTETVTYKSNMTLSDDVWTGLLDNVASVISQNKYTLLQNMVKQGMLRLVVDNGTIETNLTFDASSTTTDYKNITDFDRGTTKSVGRGSMGAKLFGFFGASASKKTTTTTFNVSTTQKKVITNDDTNVEITGRVKINFSTDYLKLLEEPATVEATEAS